MYFIIKKVLILENIKKRSVWKTNFAQKNSLSDILD